MISEFSAEFQVATCTEEYVLARAQQQVAAYYGSLDNVDMRVSICNRADSPLDRYLSRVYIHAIKEDGR